MGSGDYVNSPAGGMAFSVGDLGVCGGEGGGMPSFLILLLLHVKHLLFFNCGKI